MTEPVFICECANDGCTEQLAVDLDNYQRVREEPRLFFVIPGHQAPHSNASSRPTATTSSSRRSGEAGEVAEQTHT